MTAAAHLDGRYRAASSVMIVGWLIGLFVFTFSWLKARSAVNVAIERAQRIWVNPQDVDPANLPDDVRLALLALIQEKQMRPRRRYEVPALSSDEIYRFKLLPQARRANLVRDFVRVGLVHPTYGAAMLGTTTPLRSASPAIIVVFDDSWRWLVETGMRASWPDEPGENWWFVDPATGRRANRELSDIESEMEWVNVSAVIAFTFSLPWLWYFVLIQLGEGSGGG
jgi:integrase